MLRVYRQIPHSASVYSRRVRGRGGWSNGCAQSLVSRIRSARGIALHPLVGLDGVAIQVVLQPDAFNDGIQRRNREREQRASDTADRCADGKRQDDGEIGKLEARSEER